MTKLISLENALELVKNICNTILSECEGYYDPEVDDIVYKDILEVDAILRCNKEIRNALRNMPAETTQKLNMNTSDLIYRSDALACFHDWVDKYGDVHSADEMPEYQRIEALPSGYER